MIWMFALRVRYKYLLLACHFTSNKYSVPAALMRRDLHVVLSAIKIPLKLEVSLKMAIVNTAQFGNYVICIPGMVVKGDTSKVPVNNMEGKQVEQK